LEKQRGWEDADGQKTSQLIERNRSPQAINSPIRATRPRGELHVKPAPFNREVASPVSQAPDRAVHGFALFMAVVGALRASRSGAGWHGRWASGKARMSWLVTKYLITAALVVAVSELAKRSDRFGGLIAALPLVTLLTLIWLHAEHQPQAKVANHAWYTFWYVVPTLPMFLAFPALLPRIGFWPSMLAGVVITILCFTVFALVMRNFGVDLLP